MAFEPNAVQQPLAKAGILTLFGGFPCVFYLLAAALLLARLSLTRRYSVRRSGLVVCEWIIR